MSMASYSPPRHSRRPSRAPSRVPSRAPSRGPSRAPSRAPSRGREGTAPFKRLIVAADGTWLNSDNGLVNGELSIPSNVTRLSRAIKEISSDGIPQIVYYHFGVGSRGGAVDRFVQGATGEGLEENVREGYAFLATNYTRGDEIFLLGFSRGAFTARSIAGLVGDVGLLTKRGLPFLTEIYRDVQHARDPAYRPKYRDLPFRDKPSAADPAYREELADRGLTRLGVGIKAIGVWDTVGALGTPRLGWLTRLGLQTAESRETAFHDTTLSSCVEHAFQALALDERRSAFAPAVWEKPDGNKTVLRQVWFPGVHSNVGGGYDDQQLANITLAWMMAQLEPFLDMRHAYLFEQDDENVEYEKSKSGGRRRGKPRPWSFGKIVNSMAGLYALGGGTTRTPGRYRAVDPDTRQATRRPLRDTHEYVHPSARSRLFLGGPGVDDKGVYECPALRDWKLVVDYKRGGGRDDGEPDVYWKLTTGERDVSTRVLPEAPLWALERDLARRDPETYDYVRRPPPTKKKKDRRRGDRISEGGASRRASGREFGDRYDGIDGEGRRRRRRASLPEMDRESWEEWEDDSSVRRPRSVRSGGRPRMKLRHEGGE